MKQYFFAIALLIVICSAGEIRAENTALYDLSEVSLQEDNGKHSAYLKDGSALSGAVALTDSQGRKITYFYRDGLRDGVAVSRYGDNKIELEITYSRGMKNGEEILFYTNGNPQHKKTYKNNILDGEELFFYENGHPKQKNTYKDGKLDGEIGYYTEDGNVLKIEHYKNGLKNGIERIVENNVLKEEYNYLNGKLNGLAKLYNGEYLTDEISYKDGLKDGKHIIYKENGYRAEIPYVKGKKSGEGILYAPNKKIAERVFYQNDMKNGLKIKYAENGAVLAKEYYKNDKKEGISRQFNDKGELLSVAYYVNDNELARKNIADDKLLNDIYTAYSKGVLNRYAQVKSHWYPILWLGLSAENMEIIKELEEEMKMYGASIADLHVYERESHSKYADYNRELFIGLTPLSYLINLQAPVEFLNKFSTSKAAIEEDNPRSTTALQEAVHLNNIEMLRYLLLKGADVQKIYKGGKTILLEAIDENDAIEVIEELLKSGANVNAKDNHGNTPLVLAIKKANTGLIKLLLQYKADKNDVKMVLGEDILHYIYENNKNSELISILLADTEDVNIKDKNGRLLIIKALQANDDNMVKLLLKSNADVDLTDDSGNNAVSYILNNDVSPEIRAEILPATQNFSQNVASFNKPLWLIALDNNQKDVMQVAIEKSDIMLADDNGNIPFYTILQKCEDEEILTLLFAKVKEIGDDSAWQILYMNKFNIMEKAASKGFNANSVNEQGDNMLIYAVKNGYDTKFADILISQGADVDKYDNDKQTALEIAVKNNDIAWAEKLIDLGANINQLSNGRPYLSYVLKNQKDMSDLLIRNGLNTDFVTESGETMLMSAVKNLNVFLLQYLLEQGVDAEAKDNDGQTAVFYLADSLDVYSNESLNDIIPLWIKIIRILKDNNVDINDQNINGDTLLMLIAQKYAYKYPEIRNFLVQEGADAQLKNQYGKTADEYLSNN